MTHAFKKNLYRKCAFLLNNLVVYDSDNSQLQLHLNDSVGEYYASMLSLIYQQHLTIVRPYEDVVRTHLSFLQKLNTDV